jgi:thiamine biosynthesis protein ThiS
MNSDLTIQLNGTSRTLASLPTPAPLAEVITRLELKADRIAVELNGEIATRTKWPSLTVNEGDKLEIVHFVGGGSKAT